MMPKRGNIEAGSTSGTKKPRYKSADSDDDFQERVPGRPIARAEYVVPNNNSDSASVSSDDEEVFQSRNSPKLLIDAMKAFNDAQQKAVHELGFGHLFHLELDEIPGRMTTWCLDRLDPVTCSIELKNAMRLHLDSDDVFLMFGFPKGPEEIKRGSRIKDKELLEAWAARHHRKKNKVLPSQLVSSMLAEVDAGVWFKREFLILVECCLIENASDGYLKPKVIDVIRDVSLIKQFNWCDHVINALHISHRRWLSNKTGNFTGPALFLVLFYADRTVHYKRYVDRVFPLIKGWNADLLRLRQRAELQTGGFGTGFVVERFDPTSLLRTKYDSMYTEKKPEGRTADLKEEPEGQIDDAIAYTNKLLAAAKVMADSMSTMMQLIKGAPDVLRLNGSFTNAVQTCRAVLGVSPNNSDSTECGVNVCSQKLMEDEFSSPEWNEAIVRMMEVFEERQKMEESWDGPSFSLGLSQCPVFNRNNFSSPSKTDYAAGNSAGVNVDVDNAGTDEPCFGECEGPHVVNGDGQDIDVPQRVAVDRTVEGVPSTMDKEHLKESVMSRPDGRFPLSKVTIDVEATLASVLKVVQESHNEMESSEDEIPIMQLVKMGRKKKKGKGQASALKMAHAAKIDVPVIKESSLADVEDPSMKDKKGKAPMSEGSVLIQRKMETRTMGERQKASSLLSPFNVRKVSAEPRLDTVDKQLFYWLISKAKTLEERILFNDNDRIVVGSDFQSFRPATSLCANLLDAWSMYLNSQESLKSAESPSRFFCTTFPCSFTIVDTQQNWSAQKIRDAFFDRVSAEFKKHQSLSLAKTDLVFFPIIQANHFYVMVFNLKGKKVVLLDNSIIDDDEPLCIKYGNIPATLVQLFCDYLESHKLGLKAIAMRKFHIDRMKLAWRNDWNNVDCAVYAMRHMEVYMGQTVRDWDIDLKKDPRKQLMYLRIKYCRVLLTCEINLFRTRNLDEAKAAFDTTCVSNFDRFLETINKKQ